MGKVVGDLQSNVAIGKDYITGTSKYVTGYTGFSGKSSEQKGNYLALHASADTGATISVELVGGTSGEKTLDADGIVILRLEPNKTYSLKVNGTKNGKTQTRVFKLGGVVLEPAG